MSSRSEDRIPDDVYAEREALKAQVKSLKDLIADQQTITTSLKSENEHIKADREKLRLQLKQRKQAPEPTSTRELRGQVEVLQQQLQHTQHQLAVASKGGSDTNAELRRLREDNEELRRRLVEEGIERGAEAMSLQGRVDESEALRGEVDILRTENASLRVAVQDAEAMASQADQKAVAMQQRLLRVEAECSALHESLREAQQLLEEALAENPSMLLAGRERVEAIQKGMAHDTLEIAKLHEALQEAQARASSAEQLNRELHRSREQAMRDLQLLLKAAQDPSVRGASDRGEPTSSRVQKAQAYINSLRTALATAKSQLTDSKRLLKSTSTALSAAGGSASESEESLPLPPAYSRHQTSGRSRIPPAKLRQIQTADKGTLQRMLEDAYRDIADLRESAAEEDLRNRLADVPLAAVEGKEADRELLGPAWDSLLTPEERLNRYRARLRQVLTEAAEVRDENRRLKDECDRLERDVKRTRHRLEQSVSPARKHDDGVTVQQLMRELQEARGEANRLRGEKQRLLLAVKQASAQREAHEDLARRRGVMSDSASSMASDSYGTESDGSDSEHSMHGEKLRNHVRLVNHENKALREERDTLVDQLVAARAAAQAAELLKLDSQDERRDLLGRLEEAQARIVELQNRLSDMGHGPVKVDRSVSPILEHMIRMSLPVDVLGDLPDADEEGLDVTPVMVTDEKEEEKQRIDEYALESLRHVLQQTQQLLERSDQQLLDERDKTNMLMEQIEELREALEKTLKEGAELQRERDSLAIERDQWAQAARDADDARRKLVEHVEQLQTVGSPSRAADGKASPKNPEIADLLREKAELSVQIDILKERLADSMEELEGARRELVNALDARSELQREQDKNIDLMQSLREVEASRDRLEQEKAQLQEESQHLQYQLDNANLVKKCNGERVDQMKREMEEMKNTNDQLRRELEAQMKEIGFLCDTLTETSAQYEDCAQRLEQADADRNKLLAEKHKDLQRIEELSAKLTQVRLHNDKEAVEERKQLQSEREFDALMLADRMKELEACKEEIAAVKSRATKAIGVLKASLQNALMQMKTLGDEFEAERSELQERLYFLDKEHKEKCNEAASLKAELEERSKKEGVDDLKDKIAALSNGLQETKAKFSEQTQAYEKAKAELRAARQQLTENADFKALFQEANDAMERITGKNTELLKENRDLRETLESMREGEAELVKATEDKATKALREQLENYQTELKREKDLRMRLREENDRVQKEMGRFEKEMKGMVDDLTKQLQQKTDELQGIHDHHAQQKDKLKSNVDDEHAARRQLEQKLMQLEIDYHQREEEVQLLAQELESQRSQSGVLLQDASRSLSASKAEVEELQRALLRIENMALSYGPSRGVVQRTPLGAALDEGGADQSAEEMLQTITHDGAISSSQGDEPGLGSALQPAMERRVRSSKELTEEAYNAVRDSLEHLQHIGEGRTWASREEVGHAQAEFEAIKIDLIERLKKVEEEKALVLDELATANGENRRFRDENASLRAEKLRMTEMGAGADGYRKLAESLQNELRGVLDERDELLGAMQQQKSAETEEVSSLIEANKMAGVTVDKLRRELANAQAELSEAMKQREGHQKVVDGLTENIKAAQESLAASERTVGEARRERDDACMARDKALRDKAVAEKAIEDVRRELRQSKADFARLQAVCQDLDGLNAMVDSTQEELVRTKDKLRETTAELARLQHSRDADIEDALRQQSIVVDEQLRALEREKEELVRKLETALREKDHAERSQQHSDERTKIEMSQLERDRKELVTQLEEQHKLACERQDTIDTLRKELVLSEIHGAPAPAASPGELEAVKAELSKVVHELEQKRAEVDHLTAQNQQLREDLSRIRMGAADQEALQSQLAANLEDLHVLTRRVTKAEDEALRASQLAQQKDDKVKEAVSALESARTALEEKTALCANLEEEVLRLRDELVATQQELDEGRDLMLSLVGPPDGVLPRGASATPSVPRHDDPYET